jgi:hypothetical protein
MNATLKRSPRARQRLVAILDWSCRWKGLQFLAICATMIAIGQECQAQLPGAAGGLASPAQRYNPLSDPFAGGSNNAQKYDPIAAQDKARGQGDLDNDKVNQALAALQEARKSLQQSIAKKDQGMIAQHQEQLKNAINDYLKQDLAVSETHLKRLRDQWSALEASHKKRVAARQELIDLQLQAMLLAKQGLSIPTTDNPSALPQNWLVLGEPGASGLGMPGMAPGGMMAGGPGAGGMPGGSSLLGGGGGGLGRRYTGGGGDDNLYSGNVASPLNIEASGSGAAREWVLNYADLRTNTLQQRAQLQQAVATSWQLLEQADEEAAEQEAKDLLRDALSKYFDFDLEQRELRLQLARQEIEKLDKKLQKRKSLTDSMVELQMKIELNESNGLGFFSPSNG